MIKLANKPSTRQQTLEILIHSISFILGTSLGSLGMVSKYWSTFKFPQNPLSPLSRNIHLFQYFSIFIHLCLFSCQGKVAFPRDEIYISLCIKSMREKFFRASNSSNKILLRTKIYNDQVKST